jgi:hypothetical protein
MVTEARWRRFTEAAFNTTITDLTGTVYVRGRIGFSEPGSV